jgi:iron complex outermembrane receptor protein
MRAFAWSHAAPRWLRSKATPLSLLALLSFAAAAPAMAQTTPNNSDTIGPLIVTEPKRKPVQRVETNAGRPRVHARVASHTRTSARKPVPAPVPGPVPAPSATEAVRTPLNSNVVATSASRLGLTVLETPATVEIVDQQTMREQGYRTTTETAQGAVGVLSGDAAGAPAGYSMRGFTGSAIISSTMESGLVRRISPRASWIRPISTAWNFSKAPRR